MTDENQRYLMIAGAIAAALLFAAILPMPYGYYRLLRVAVCIIAIAFALRTYALHKVGLTVVLAATAILFNPLVPLGFEREVWAAFNLIGAALFVWLAIQAKRGDFA